MIFPSRKHPFVSICRFFFSLLLEGFSKLEQRQVWKHLWAHGGRRLQWKDHSGIVWATCRAIRGRHESWDAPPSVSDWGVNFRIDYPLTYSADIMMLSSMWWFGKQHVSHHSFFRVQLAHLVKRSMVYHLVYDIDTLMGMGLFASASDGTIQKGTIWFQFTTSQIEV